MSGPWVKIRKKMDKYPETPQQLKIREAGEKIKEECTGKKGKDFILCRTNILKEIFHPEEDKESETS